MGGNNYPRGMQELAFPGGLADEAKALCRQAARLLQGHLTRRAEMYRSLEDWRGVYRAQFDDTWRALQRDLEELREQLLRVVGDVDDADQAVRRANSRRAQARQDYDEERERDHN